MRKALLTATMLLALVAFPAAASAAPKASSVDMALLKEMNRVRAQHGLRPLAFDMTLARAARAHTSAMAAAGVFKHGSFRERMIRFRVAGPLVGENLAWGVGARGSAQGVVAAWLASPAHRANLLHPRFNRVGLGQLQTRFYGASGANVVTADFAGS